MKTSPMNDVRAASSRRRLVLSLAALAVGAGLAMHRSQAANGAALGAAAPEFAATTADGKPLSLSSLRGKAVVLEWTNHDCPYVRKHYRSGNIPQLQKDAAAQGVVWLQVISSAPGSQGHVDGPTAMRLNRERGATPHATLLDPQGQLGRRYGARTTPQLFVIAPSGQLVYAGGIDSISSARDEDIAQAVPYVRQALGELAAGKPVSQPSTRAYGCSVKYADG